MQAHQTKSSRWSRSTTRRRHDLGCRGKQRLPGQAHQQERTGPRRLGAGADVQGGRTSMDRATRPAAATGPARWAAVHKNDDRNRSACCDQKAPPGLRSRRVRRATRATASGSMDTVTVDSVPAGKCFTLYRCIFARSAGCRSLHDLESVHCQDLDRWLVAGWCRRSSMSVGPARKRRRDRTPQRFRCHRLTQEIGGAQIHRIDREVDGPKAVTIITHASGRGGLICLSVSARRYLASSGREGPRRRFPCRKRASASSPSGASSTSYPELSSVSRIICRMCASSSTTRSFMSDLVRAVTRPPIADPRAAVPG